LVIKKKKKNLEGSKPPRRDQENGCYNYPLFGV
jgi:hypothetical protein